MRIALAREVAHEMLECAWEADAVTARLAWKYGLTPESIAPFVSAFVSQRPAPSDVESLAHALESELRELAESVGDVYEEEREDQWQRILAADFAAMGRVLLFDEDPPEPPDELEDDDDADAIAEAARVLFRVEADARRQGRPLVRAWKLQAQVPSPPAFAPGLPSIASARELAARLEVSVEELVYFADARAHRGRQAAYRHRWICKRSGGHRLLEIPRPRLRWIQRALLDRVLAQVPAHDAAHAFVTGRSVSTFAAPHAGQRFVIRMDLEDFFASVGRGRVRCIFETLGFAGGAAQVASMIAAHATPEAVLRACPAEQDDAARPRGSRSARRLRTPHLPQGAPSSPALANLAAFRLDVRLRALASAVGGQYTRYADDLAFSGGETLRRAVDRFVPRVAAIAWEEGFVIRFDKTKRMPRAQRQELCGVVVNVSPGLRRAEYDRLRARLHRVAHEPAPPAGRDAERLAAQLRGHVAHASLGRPARAAKLAVLLDRALETLSSRG